MPGATKSSQPRSKRRRHLSSNHQAKQDDYFHIRLFKRWEEWEEMGSMGTDVLAAEAIVPFLPFKHFLSPLRSESVSFVAERTPLYALCLKPL